MNITDNNIWTIVLKDSTIEVNDKVDITFSDADVLSLWWWRQ
nr:hypothetical protein [Mycoplasmopsis bovis]